MQYEVNVTLLIEAESKEQAGRIALVIVNFGGADDDRFIGWDLEEIEEAP